MRTRGCLKLPRMYPFSLTDCSVGRFMRNFISLVRTLFWSVSPAELEECMTLGLEAGKCQDNYRRRSSSWVTTLTSFARPYVFAFPRRPPTSPLVVRPRRRSSRTSRRPPPLNDGPGTPGGNPAEVLLIIDCNYMGKIKGLYFCAFLFFGTATLSFESTYRQFS